MTSGPTYKVDFKRKLKQKTNYVKRLAMLKSGKSRFIVRLSNALVRCQITNYNRDGDYTLLSNTSKDLVDLGWKCGLNNTPAIYLTALLLSKRAEKKDVKEVVFDLGNKNYKSKSKIFAALKAVADSNLECNYSEKAFPNEDRIIGKAFDEHLKNNISSNFKEVKEKILKM